MIELYKLIQLLKPPEQYKIYATNFLKLFHYKFASKWEINYAFSFNLFVSYFMNICKKRACGWKVDKAFIGVYWVLSLHFITNRGLRKRIKYFMFAKNSKKNNGQIQVFLYFDKLPHQRQRVNIIKRFLCITLSLPISSGNSFFWQITEVFPREPFGVCLEFIGEINLLLLY